MDSKDVIALVEDLTGVACTDHGALLRSDLKIDGDEGWTLLLEIEKRMGLSGMADVAAQVFHDEADMVLHRVALRKLGLRQETLDHDLPVSELIAAVDQMRLPVPTRS